MQVGSMLDALHAQYNTANAEGQRAEGQPANASSLSYAQGDAMGRELLSNAC
jgi:hypothetical protein